MAFVACQNCGAKYDSNIADWQCPVCGSTHPDQPSSDLHMVALPNGEFLIYKDGLPYRHLDAVEAWAEKKAAVNQD